MLLGTKLYPGIMSGLCTSLVCASIRLGRQLFVALSELCLLLLNDVQVSSITTSSPNRRVSYLWRIMFVEGNELSVHSFHTACVFASRFSGGSNTNELLQLCMLNFIWAYTSLTYKLCIKYCVYAKSNRKF
jgi:hypothetical protein